MNDHLVGERRLARRCSLPGALILYSIAALALLAEAVHCAMLPAAELPGLWGDPLFEALLVLSQMTAIAAILLLGEFLRHFGADASPFGAGQSARLLAAAGLLVGRVLLEATIKLSFDLGSLAAPPIPCILETELDLKLVAIVIFLGCLAMVVRYGNALKEDSDSFV